EAELTRQRNIKRWRARPHSGELDAGLYVASQRSEAAGVTLNLGLRLVGNIRPTLLIVSEGCVLEEAPLPGPAPGLMAILSGDFPTDGACASATRGRPLGEALLHLLELIERLMADVASRFPVDDAAAKIFREALLDYVVQIVEPGYPTRYLIDLGFDPALAQRLVDKHRGLQIIPRWNLPGDAESRGPPHPLALRRLFPQLAGPDASLLELHERLGRGEPLYWLAAGVSNVDEPVLRLSAGHRRWIEATLGAAALTDYRPRLEQLHFERSFMRRVTEPVELAQVTLKVRHTRDKIECLWGLVAGGDTMTSTSATVRVLKRRRYLGTLDLEVGLPGLTACVNDDDAVPMRIWEGVRWVDNPALVAALDEGLCALIQEAMATLPRSAGNLREAIVRLLMGLVRALYPGPELYEAHQRLREHFSADAAEREYVTLLRLGRVHGSHRLRKTLRAVLARGGSFSAKIVEGSIGKGSPAFTGPDDDRMIALSRALLAFAPLLFDQPLFAQVGGGDPLSLQAIRALVVESNALRVLDRGHPSLGYRGEKGPVVEVDARERAFLSALLGDGVLCDASPWLSDWQARRRFEERPQVAAVTLAADEVLAKIE
ncbi:MAG: hypothetical protein KC420_18115, partial [Myxococcales bacterium]|nr:hypothetical protein [Myxococcales bacterium]